MVSGALSRRNGWLHTFGLRWRAFGKRVPWQHILNMRWWFTWFAFVRCAFLAFEGQWRNNTNIIRRWFQFTFLRATVAWPVTVQRGRTFQNTLRSILR